MLSYRRVKENARLRVKRWLGGYRGYRLHDLPRVDVAFSQTSALPRINLVILGIRKEAVFGGADTALRFFKALRAFFPRARLLVLKEDESDFDPAAWGEWSLESRDPGASHTIAFLSQPGFRPAVGPDDHFVATHWLTAYYVQNTLRQAVELGWPVRPFVYLIQDFEPGFYPWSGRYLVSSATYTNPRDTIAVFNTGLLQQFVERSGYSFDRYHVFEPRLNPKLAEFRQQREQHPKRRLLLVYGRPGTARNAFDLVVETLIVWARRYPGARDWQVLSLGEQHPDVQLGGGMALRSGGKVTLQQYATHLLDAAAGLSLMVSPHPSYPPLEMAEFGVRVVTNNFANKNLSTFSDNITGLDDTTPEALAAALQAACEAHERGDAVPDARPVFIGTENEFPFIADLAAQILGTP